MGRQAHLKSERRTHRPQPPESPVARRRALVFVAKFLAFFVAVEVVYYQLIVGSPPFRRYLAGVCRAAAAVLGLAGERVTVDEATLRSSFSMSVASGCDGLQPIGILAVAVAAFPGAARHKLVVLLAGAAALFALNVVRVAALFWTGVHLPDAFQPMHVHVWPAVLIASALAIWALWAARTTRRRGNL